MSKIGPIIWEALKAISNWGGVLGVIGIIAVIVIAIILISWFIDSDHKTNTPNSDH